MPSEAAQERGSLPESRPGPSSTLTSPRVQLSPTLVLISHKVQSRSQRFHTELLGPHGHSPIKDPVLLTDLDLLQWLTQSCIGQRDITKSS